MKIDFSKFNGSLPYSSELYGVYQPLLGWKSSLMTRRFEAGINTLRRRFLADFIRRFRAQTKITSESLDPREVQFKVSVAQEGKPVAPLVAEATNSFVARRTLRAIEEAGINNPSAWKKYTSPDALTETLASIDKDIRGEYKERLAQPGQTEPLQGLEGSGIRQRQLLNTLLARESVAAGVLSFLNGQGDFQQMMSLLSPSSSLVPLENRLKSLIAIARLIDPRESALAKAVISPIGVVHLFRQYFFEFDTFLGPPVEHLWLSPGGTVELVEISTRKTLIERAVETSTESMVRSEKEISLEDELSDAVRSENTANTKFGVSLNTTSSANAIFFTSQLSTGTSFELNDSQKESREHLHKGLRRQSEKIASEMKRSFKSSFRTVTEVTDTKSRRYVIQNSTNNLMNYELRRKMRQVGVQVQDYGTHLCWQTYVDKPGDELGIANLVHIAAPVDMEPVQEGEAPTDTDPYKDQKISKSYRWPLSDDWDNDDGVKNPIEFFRELIVGKFPAVPKPGYVLNRALVSISSGPSDFVFATRLLTPIPVSPGQSETTPTEIEVFAPPVIDTGLAPPLNKRHGSVADHPEFVLEVTPEYVPSKWLLGEVSEAKKKKLEDATEKQAREYREKLFAAVKERVKFAHGIDPRKYEDLREEERIVVYRNLIRTLMTDTGVEKGEPRVQHIFAELIQSMFDVDKMLYFVAPEWWMPRDIGADQDVFRPGVDAKEFMTYSTVSWGGGKGERKDNYYITEDSKSAKLGSSLGWTIQLDGDNLRNAFLNAPWVKAVIPIREWKEKEAIEWLSASDVEGSDGLDAEYQSGSADELQRIRQTLGLAATHTVSLKDAIQYLIARVQRNHAAAREKVRDEEGNELSYLPTDKVYEHGFDPLQGGFKAQGQKPFEVFDQWIEIVPTDQIVPVEVEYDPKTGMQK